MKYLFWISFTFFFSYGEASSFSPYERWAQKRKISQSQRLFAQKIVFYLHQENQRILKNRRFALLLQKKIAERHTISPLEKNYLSTLFSHYRVKSIQGLLHKMDVVPVSLGLAQSIEESGWGKSTPARTKNACFGMSKGGKCISFPTVKQSVIAYIDNLNRHKAYESFRRIRQSLRAGGRLRGRYLVSGLKHYGNYQAYPKRISYIIQRLSLEILDQDPVPVAEKSTSSKK